MGHRLIDTPGSDHALVARIATGDEDALAELYARHRPRLWRYLWHHLDGQAPWVEEVLQDCFLAVWNSARSFRGDAQVVTWIFRIAHHTVQKAWRDRQRHAAPRREQSLTECQDDPALAGERVIASPEDAIITRLILSDALADLSVNHRDVLELIFYHGFTLEETAIILNVPLGTVKSRLTYARRALQRTMLAAQAPEETHHEA